MFKSTLFFSSNPVLQREMRVRWRGGRIFLVLLGFSMILAVGALLFYACGTQHYSDGENSLTWMQESGHDMFATITVLQVIVWLLIAPLLTSSSISSEREQGLLEALQLSSLRPEKIVRGKYISALSLIFLIIVTTMPILALSFLLGGVSPMELLLATLLNFVGAATGAALGMACSAWSRRANTALSLTIFSTLCWLGVTGALLWTTWVQQWAPQHTAMQDTFGFEFFTPSSANPLAIVTNLLGHCNPLVGLMALLDGRFHADLCNSPFFAGVDPVIASLVTQATLIPFLLWLANCGTRKIFKDQPVTRPRRVLGWQRDTRGVRLGWQAPPDALAVAEMRAASKRDSANSNNAEEKTLVETVKRWHNVPVLALVAFSNPILHREFHGRFRLRYSPWLVALGVVIGIPLLIVYMHCACISWYGIWETGEWNLGITDRNAAWALFTLGSLVVGSIGMAFMTAKSLARERETGSWGALQLSMLTRRDIILGKLLAPLLFCLCLSLPWLLMLGSGVRSWMPVYHEEDYGWYLSPTNISIVQAALAFWIIGAALLLCGATGLWVAWRCRRTTAAIGWTISTLIVFWVLLPAGCSAVVDSISCYDFAKTYFGGIVAHIVGVEVDDFSSYLRISTRSLLGTVHPFFAMSELFQHYHSNRTPHHFVLNALYCGLWQLVLTATLLFRLHRAMLRGERERPGLLERLASHLPERKRRKVKPVPQT